MAKDKTSGVQLMGFGHRVYKNFDPRAKILKKQCDKVLAKLGVEGPAAGHRHAAWKRSRSRIRTSSDRKLYPNVDFYSGIILRAIGIPLNMFTVMFAIGRLPGLDRPVEGAARGVRGAHLPPAPDIHRRDNKGIGADRQALTAPREGQSAEGCSYRGGTGFWPGAAPFVCHGARAPTAFWQIRLTVPMGCVCKPKV